MNGMFSECSQLQDISALSNWNTSKVIDADDMLIGCGYVYDIAPILGQFGNRNGPISGSRNFMFDWEIKQLKAHITRLEEQIAELTKINISKSDITILEEKIVENMELKSQIARLEERIAELTKQKEKSTSWYQPIIELFSAD